MDVDPGPTEAAAVTAVTRARAELTCAICLSLVRAPHLLSCGHLFCGGCLRTMARTAAARGTRLACPTCRGRASGDAAPVRVLALDGVLEAVLGAAPPSGGGTAAAAWTDDDAGELAALWSNFFAGDSDDALLVDDDAVDGDYQYLYGDDVASLLAPPAERLRARGANWEGHAPADVVGALAVAADAAAAHPDGGTMLAALFDAVDCAAMHAGHPLSRALCALMAAFVTAGAAAAEAGPAAVAHNAVAAADAVSDAEIAACVAALRGAAGGDHVDELVQALAAAPRHRRNTEVVGVELRMRQAASEAFHEVVEDEEDMQRMEEEEEEEEEALRTEEEEEVEVAEAAQQEARCQKREAAEREVELRKEAARPRLEQEEEAHAPQGQEGG